jgi:hypothetical protein
MGTWRDSKAPAHSRNFVKRTDSHIGRCVHMAQVEQYRRQAAEWERLAAEAKSPGSQECYRSLAQQWWELAAAMKRLSRVRLPNASAERARDAAAGPLGS